MERIGFVGLGIMGRGMAANLLRAGFPLTVWNRTASRMELLVAPAPGPEASPADVAAQSDIVVICVSDTPDVEAVILGEQGHSPGRASRHARRRLQHHQPPGHPHPGQPPGRAQASICSTRPSAAAAKAPPRGTLSIMVGGAADQFARALPVFQAMGKTITHVGDHGAGQTVKLVNQVLVVGNCLAMAEALLFAQAGGVDLQKTYDAISQGAAGSWMFTHRGPQVMQRDWRPGFTVDLQQKDLRLVLEAADSSAALARHAA